MGNVDPALLFAFLFGSDRFRDYVGRLAAATSAASGLGGAELKDLSPRDARTLQKRRCGRLALSLSRRLSIWAEAEDSVVAIEGWKVEAAGLAEASYGPELLHVIGRVYVLSAEVFLGSIDSGVGLPSISAWAKRGSARHRRAKDKRKHDTDTMRADMTQMQLQQMGQRELAEAKTDEERKAVEDRVARAAGTSMLHSLWTITVVDITSTLYETCQMVLFDKSVDKKTRERRAKGIKALGEIFENAAPVKTGGKDEIDVDAQKLFEEASFAAMVETMKRKEEAKHGAN